MTPAASGIRASSAAAIVGGLLWIPIRLAIGGTWGESVAELGYVEWNRLMVVPLVLLIGGSGVLVERAGSRPARIGAWMAIAGLVGMLAGVIVEFWIVGGLESGNRDGAIAGWMVYLLAGVLVHVVGLAMFGLNVKGRLGALTVLIAVLHVLWIPAGLSGLPALLAFDQALIGAGWVAIGSLGMRERATSPVQSA